MKRKEILLVLSSLLFAGSASARAVDTWTRVSLQFTNLGRAEVFDTGIGVATVTSSGASMHIDTISVGTGHKDDPHTGIEPNGRLPGLSLNQIVPVTDPLVTVNIQSVRLTNVRQGVGQGPFGQAGIANPISGAIASSFDPAALAGGLATIPASGMVRICLTIGGPTCSINVPTDAGVTVNGVAQGGGIGGIITFGQIQNSLRVTVIGAPYTVKTITAFERTNNLGIVPFKEKGFAHGPLSNTTSTGANSGVLQIITVNHTKAEGILAVPTEDISGNFSRTLVHFIPEPGLLLLLGSGAIGMALLGRKRIRK